MKMFLIILEFSCSGRVAILFIRWLNTQGPHPILVSIPILENGAGMTISLPSFALFP